jgi:hypothetical protein
LRLATSLPAEVENLGLSAVVGAEFAGAIAPRQSKEPDWQPQQPLGNINRTHGRSTVTPRDISHALQRPLCEPASVAGPQLTVGRGGFSPRDIESSRLTSIEEARFVDRRNYL